MSTELHDPRRALRAEAPMDDENSEWLLWAALAVSILLGVLTLFAPEVAVWLGF